MERMDIEANGQEKPYPAPQPPRIPGRSVIVADYGASGDGLELCTDAIQAAIDACAAEGGGRVVVPAGIWRTGPLTLRSRIDLHLEDGALVNFEPNHELYPLVDSHFEGRAGWRCQAPLDGADLTDVAITGSGIFDGGGEGWRPVKRFKMTEQQWNRLQESGGAADESGEVWWPSREAMEGEAVCRVLQERGETEAEAYLPGRHYLRPALLSLRNCRRVLLEGPTFQNSPAWCLHPLGCEEIAVRHIRVRNPWYSQNGDGLDLESCTNALIEHSTFDVGDDAICLKSGKDEEGRRRALPCSFVTIRRCTVHHGHGGVVIGSEMSGGVHAVRISDCVFSGTEIGLRFKSARGRGGVVENIAAENIVMKDIVHEAVSFHLFYAGVEGSEGGGDEKRPVTEATPVFRRITLRNIRCSGAATALLVNGLPELPLADLTVEGLRASSRRGIVLRHADGVILRDIALRTDELPAVLKHRCRGVEIDGLERTERTAAAASPD
ncbi:glycoside hydrolase family 28 protein [Saccharibacillus sp. CPCC 101409]|uniref:glycoside hydrolase family 28 protein n=1 Tax=Saccharibacillus sp. CPCC 101409 TaxID=3058041 RepID=UPI0026719C14|nr:glycoside hydrolase family 28 protein [Saccharibacillus sp. CPCC 101409]MDO3412381.1 glycoside hydrolase family 28 protein [Saccharibacillus sp. CPCC 101409]